MNGLGALMKHKVYNPHWSLLRRLDDQARRQVRWRAWGRLWSRLKRLLRWRLRGRLWGRILRLP